MGTSPFRVSDIKGLTPGVDPARSNEQFVLNGKNYIFDSLGPKSAFGDRFLLPQPIPDPSHMQGIRLKLRSGDRCFTMTNQGIFNWDEDAGGWRLIYRTLDTSTTPYRWTWGYLAGIMFFNHPLTGIIFYDVENEYAARLEGDGVPTEVLAICVNNGRVVAMGPEWYSWSAQSDGSNWAPAVGGPGQQKINSRVPGYPIMVTPFVRGVMTWTTGGVMRSEFTGDVEVWRHRSLNTEYRPVNSFCSLQLDDDTALILDERGLFQSKGEGPVPFAPLFNEFLIRYLQDNNIRVGQNVRLEWDELRRLLFVSISLSRYDPLYEKCFVLYPPMDKWGQFDTPHYGIFPLRIDGSERADDFYGFVGEDRLVRTWTDTGSVETLPSDTTLNLFYPLIQKPFEQEAGGEFLTLSSTMVFNTYNDILTTQRASYYPYDGTSPEEPVLAGLDAHIQVGFFRGGEGVSMDECIELSQILVRSNLSGEEDRISLNFALDPPDVPDTDYEAEGTDDNFGVDDINYVNHQLRVIASNDGVTQFTETVPELVGFAKAARFYSCSIVGVWHIIEFRAETVGEAFHVQTLELTGAGAGRLL